MKGEEGVSHLHVAWRRSEKQQPGGAKFRVSVTDAPNVNGARDWAAVGGGNDGEADLSSLRAAVDQGRVAVLYVVDPGPAGSLGKVDWVVDARKSGRLPVLIYQGVLQTDLAKVADVVLPGAAWVEKDACYTNDQGHVQGASRAISPPGESVEDWQIVTSVAAALGLDFTYATSEQVRQTWPGAGHRPGYEDLLSRHTTARERRALAQRQQPDGANEMERDVPGPAAGQGTQRPDGKARGRRR